MTAPGKPYWSVSRVLLLIGILVGGFVACVFVSFVILWRMFL